MTKSSPNSSSIIYNSLNPHFSFQLFFEQLFFHLFFPFSVPYFLSKYGWSVYYAHGLQPTKIRNILANWIFPLAIFISIITAQYLPDRIGHGCYVPVCIFLIHRFMIALKYGTMSQSEYSKFLDLNRIGGIYSPVTSEYLINLTNYQSQLQIIQGWYHISPDHISYELHAAARRLDINLDTLQFYVPIPSTIQSNNSNTTNNTTDNTNNNNINLNSNTKVGLKSKDEFSIHYQYELWKCFLQKDDLLSEFPRQIIQSISNSNTNLSNSQEYLCINSLHVCQSLFSLCNPPISKSLILLNVIISLIFSLLPLFFMFISPNNYSINSTYSNSQSKSSSSNDLSFIDYFIFISFHFSSFLINFFLFQSLLFILFICIIDTRRKYHIFTHLSSFIRMHDIDMESLQITTTQFNTSSSTLTSNSANLSSSNLIPQNNSQISPTNISNKIITTSNNNNRGSIFSILRNQRSVTNSSDMASTSRNIDNIQQTVIGNNLSRRTFRKTSIILSENLVPFSSPFFSTTRVNQLSSSSTTTNGMKVIDKEDNQILEIENMEKDLEEMIDDHNDSHNDNSMIVREISPLLEEVDEENQVSSKASVMKLSSPSSRTTNTNTTTTTTTTTKTTKSIKAASIRTAEETKTIMTQDINGSFTRLPYEFKTYIGDDTGNSIPRIDFEMKTNLFTWCSIRLILHAFGDRMKFRIDCYLVVITCFMLILMIVIFLTFYGDSGSIHPLVNDSLFWQTMMCVILCFILMGINLTYLYLINTQMKLQRGILSLIILTKYRYINQLEMYFQREIYNSTEITITRAYIQELLLQQSEIISSFENILNLLDKVDEIKGSKLAGFKIERQHIVWVITTLLLFLYSIAQFMNKQSHSQNSIF